MSSKLKERVDLFELAMYGEDISQIDDTAELVMLSQSEFGKNLNMYEKMVILEFYLGNHNIINEVTSQENIEYFKILENMSDKLEVGQKYIALWAMLIDNKVRTSEFLESGTLTKIGDRLLAFVDDTGRTREFPNRQRLTTSFSNVFFFRTNNQYNKFKTLVSLKYKDNDLPAVKDDLQEYYHNHLAQRLNEALKPTKRKK